MDNTPLRVAATRNADNSIHYGLGFDDEWAVVVTRTDLVSSPTGLNL